MNADQIRTAVLTILETVAPELDPSTIDPAQPLRPQIELDSMDWLNIVVGLQEHFGIKIPETDYHHLGTLDGILAYLAAKLARPVAG